jgi:hypothetical protein
MKKIYGWKREEGNENRVKKMKGHRKSRDLKEVCEEMKKGKTERNKRKDGNEGRTAEEADVTHLKVLTAEIVSRGPQWSERTTLGQPGSKTLNCSRLAAWGILPPSSHFCLREKKTALYLLAAVHTFCCITLPNFCSCMFAFGPGGYCLNDLRRGAGGGGAGVDSRHRQGYYSVARNMKIGCRVQRACM